MKRYALALAFIAMAAACKKAEQQPAQGTMSDSTKMMADSTKMMGDSTHMMGDTTKH